MKKSILIALSFVLFGMANAQNNSTTNSQSGGSDLYKGWSASLNLGVTQPYTDINQFQYFKTFKNKNENRPAFQLGVKKMFSSVLGLQADFAAGTILGDVRPEGKSISGHSEDAAYLSMLSNTFGAYNIKNGIYFKTNFYQVSTSLYFDLNNLGITLFNVRKGFLVKRRVALYSYIGIGVIHFNSQIKTLKGDSAFTTYGAGVSGKSLESVVPVGLGVKYKINNKINYIQIKKSRFLIRSLE